MVRNVDQAMQSHANKETSLAQEAVSNMRLLILASVRYLVIFVKLLIYKAITNVEIFLKDKVLINTDDLLNFTFLRPSV